MDEATMHAFHCSMVFFKLVTRTIMRKLRIESHFLTLCVCAFFGAGGLCLSVRISHYQIEKLEGPSFEKKIYSKISSGSFLRKFSGFLSFFAFQSLR